MTTFQPRYDGDTLEQFLRDTECASYEGDGPGMAKHLKEAHGVEPEYERPGTQGAWSAVADQHVAAHKRELEGLEDPNGLAYKWNFNEEPESFASHMALEMLAGKGTFWEEFAGRRSPSQPDICMRVHLNGVEVDAGGMLRILELNFDNLIARGIEDKLRELEFEKLHQLLEWVEKGAARVIRERCEVIGVKLPEREEWQ